jgi:hypothetical protein
VLFPVLQPALRNVLERPSEHRPSGEAPVVFPQTLFAGGRKGAVYDPSDSTTLFQDTGGTTPAGVGDPVGKMLDLSGNGYHLIQATSTARPILRQDGAGKYYLEADPVDDKMHCDTFVVASAALYGAFGFVSTWVPNSRLVSMATTVGGTDYNADSEIALALHGSAPSSYGPFRNYVQVDSEALVTPGDRAILEVGTNAVNLFAKLTQASGGTQQNFAHAAGASLSILQMVLFAATQGGSYSGGKFYGGIFIDRIPDAAERTDTLAWIVARTGAL